MRCFSLQRECMEQLLLQLSRRLFKYKTLAVIVAVEC